MSLPRPKLYKIPGQFVAAKEKYIKDLPQLTHIELIDLKAREEHLLKAQSKTMEKLPDKGKRLREFYDKILAEIERRSNIEDAAAMFSTLNITSKGVEKLNEMEWKGHLVEDHDAFDDPSKDLLDSDDEADPIRIMAQRTMHKKQVIVIPKQPTLITEADLKDINSFKDENKNGTENINAIQAEIVAVDIKEKLQSLKPKLEKIVKSTTPQLNCGNSVSSNSQCSTPASEQQDLDQHSIYLMEKSEIQSRQPSREKFKPYKTTISNVHDPEKERNRKIGKNWEVTAATPPLIKHKETQMITLSDSVEIQKNYLAKLLESREKQATERLMAKFERTSNSAIGLPSAEVLKTNAAFTKYRQSVNPIEGKQMSDSKEIEDSEDFGTRTSGVSYKVIDYLE